jgi:hypothetical protein
LLEHDCIDRGALGIRFRRITEFRIRFEPLGEFFRFAEGDLCLFFGPKFRRVFREFALFLREPLLRFVISNEFGDCFGLLRLIGNFKCIWTVSAFTRTYGNLAINYDVTM